MATRRRLIFSLPMRFGKDSRRCLGERPALHRPAGMGLIALGPIMIDERTIAARLRSRSRATGTVPRNSVFRTISSLRTSSRVLATRPVPAGPIAPVLPSTGERLKALAPAGVSIYVCGMHRYRTANLLAALAVAIGDELHQPDLSSSAVAALLTVAQWEPMGAQELAAVIGLTQSATVRLVDELAVAGLVRRLDKVGRAVPLALTAAGRRRARALQARRLAVVERALASLGRDERAGIGKALPRLLAALTGGRAAARRICRFCDHGVCGEGKCPVGSAATAIDGPFVRPQLERKQR
jgi:DNA-binding MarR family transcriptional regulator